MNIKTKTTLYNFIGFAVLFLIARFAFDYFFPLSRFIVATAAAIVATILSPKFRILKTKAGDKIMMKWIFIKEIKEL